MVIYPVLAKRNGITVRDLKEYLAIIPEENEEGEPNEVWIMTGDGLSSVANFICRLGASDIILSHEE